MTKQLSDCKGCKSAELCGDRDFYSYGQIRFCRIQMVFLIEHIPELSEGNWPDNPEGSSYVDVPINKGVVKSEAYFTKPCEMAGEVYSRLLKTGKDGKILRNQIRAGDEWPDFEPEAKMALNYISGLERRWLKRKGRVSETYAQWKAKRNYEDKKR